MDVLLDAVRGALRLALASHDVVRVILRGDPVRGISARVVEGVVVDVGPGHDGRERVVLGIAEDTQQVFLIERIAKVLPAT